MVCVDRISLQCPAGAARVNSEADYKALKDWRRIWLLRAVTQQVLQIR